MGMSTHVVAFTSPNNTEYQKHAKVLKVCLEAGLKQLPPETAEYFGDSYVDESLLEEKLEVDVIASKFSGDMVDGYEVYLKDIPAGVEKIRFYNSY
jgi:hypothetical protein